MKHVAMNFVVRSYLLPVRFTIEGFEICGSSSTSFFHSLNRWCLSGYLTARKCRMVMKYNSKPFLKPCIVCW